MTLSMNAGADQVDTGHAYTQGTCREEEERNLVTAKGYKEKEQMDIWGWRRGL